MQGESKSKHICAHKNCNFTFYHCNAESWITKWDCPFLLHRGFIISPILLTFNMPWGCKRERREKDVALVSRKGFCFLNHISLCSRSLSYQDDKCHTILWDVPRQNEHLSKHVGPSGRFVDGRRHAGERKTDEKRGRRTRDGWKEWWMIWMGGVSYSPAAPTSILEPRFTSISVRGERKGPPHCVFLSFSLHFDCARLQAY